MSTIQYVQCTGRTRVIIFYITREFLKPHFQIQLVCPTYDLWLVLHVILYVTFFVIRFQVLCCGSYKLLQICCRLECYSYLGISIQVGDFPYLGTMKSKCGPGPFVVFISIACVISFVVYLSVEFLNEVLWKVVVSCNGLYFLPFFLFFAWIKW